MRRAWFVFVVVALILSASAVGAGPARVERGEHSLDVITGGQRLAVSLSDGGLSLKSADGDYAFAPSIKLGEGWCQPMRAVDGPIIHEKDGHVHVEVRYPVADEREFALSLESYDDVDVVFVTSRLRNLGQTRGEYYFWQTNACSKEYATAGQTGIETVAFDLKQSMMIHDVPWLYLLRHVGGLCLLPTSSIGRPHGEGGCVYLHAVPRSNTVEPSDSLDASFAVAFVRDAGAAAALAERAGPLLSLPAPIGRDADKSFDWGQPAPPWLRQADRYNLYYHPSALWTDEVVERKLRHFPLIIGSTPDKAALDKCHAAGVRLLHYVVYVALLDTKQQLAGGRAVYSEWKESIDHENRDLSKHPDWVCIDAAGNRLHDRWGQDHGHVGLMSTCLHQPGLQEAAIRQVRMLMELGFDGVFVDLAGQVEECHGHKLGVHRHPYPAMTNTQAYELLLKKIYKTVKSYGQDRIVMQNTCTSILPSHWAYCDSQMLEAFPFGAESARLRASWTEVLWQAKRCRGATEHGKVPVILSYFGQAEAKRSQESADFAYVFSKLFDLLMADAFTLEDLQGAEAFCHRFYQTRLGLPLGEVQMTGDVLCRRYEKGLAVLNPARFSATVSIPVDQNVRWTDVAEGQISGVQDGALRLKMEAQSARVLASP